MITFQYFLVIAFNIWFPPGPFAAIGQQPPNVPTQYVYLPIAPGTNLTPQGPIQYPPPPAPDPGQSRFFRHYHGGRR